MKVQRKAISSFAFAILPLLLAANFNACSNETALSPQTDSTISPQALGKIDNSYPQSASVVVKYHNGSYKNAMINLGQGSKFIVPRGALTPPPGTPKGADVTITMTAEKDELTNELVFSFGPSGCHFNPAARLRLDYSDLNIDTPGLFYIDQDNYVEQTPDHIDYQGKFILLNIDHFSRYAVAWSR